MIFFKFIFHSWGMFLFKLLQLFKLFGWIGLGLVRLNKFLNRPKVEFFWYQFYLFTEDVCIIAHFEYCEEKFRRKRHCITPVRQTVKKFITSISNLIKKIWYFVINVLNFIKGLPALFLYFIINLPKFIKSVPKFIKEIPGFFITIKNRVLAFINRVQCYFNEKKKFVLYYFSKKKRLLFYLIGKKWDRYKGYCETKSLQFLAFYKKWLGFFWVAVTYILIITSFTLRCYLCQNWCIWFFTGACILFFIVYYRNFNNYVEAINYSVENRRQYFLIELFWLVIQNSIQIIIIVFLVIVFFILHTGIPRIPLWWWNGTPIFKN